jgi:hypothetical protein
MAVGKPGTPESSHAGSIKEHTDRANDSAMKNARAGGT